MAQAKHSTLHLTVRAAVQEGEVRTAKRMLACSGVQLHLTVRIALKGKRGEGEEREGRSEPLKGCWLAQVWNLHLTVQAASREGSFGPLKGCLLARVSVKRFKPNTFA